MTKERRDAIEALERILNYCEEIDNHCPEEQRTGYKMYPDAKTIFDYLYRSVHDLTERDVPKARFQCRCGVCDLDLNECDWGDEDWQLSENLEENFKYCPRCGQRIDWGHDELYDNRGKDDDEMPL